MSVGLKAVTGISDHIGWAELVTVGVHEERPTILERRRVELIDAGIPSAPYHHEGPELPLGDARRLVARTRQSVEERCRVELSRTKAAFAIDSIAIQESPMKQLPDELADIFASRRITCAADGMMYRELLADVGAGLGLKVFRYPRRSDEIGVAAEALGATRAAVTTMLAAFGRQVGPPWRKEHQVAAASALRVLASAVVRSSRAW